MVTAYAPKYQLDKAQRELKKREASGREERGKEELYKWLQKKTLHSSLPDGQKYTTQLYELLSPRYTCLEGLLCITLATQAEDERCLERLRFSQVGNHNYLKSSEEVELVRLVGGINETQTLLSWIGEEIQERKKVHARRLSGRCYDQGNPELVMSVPFAKNKRLQNGRRVFCNHRELAQYSLSLSSLEALW